jgi:glycosyltransferase involved in cell wall biosynthesis
MEVSILTATIGWGGAESHTVGMVKELQRKDHKVSIVQLGHDLYSNKILDKNHETEFIRFEVSGPPGSMGLLKSLLLLRKVKGQVCVFPKGNFAAGSWGLDIAARISFPQYITIEHSPCQALPKKASKRYLWGLLPGIGLWWYRIRLSRLLRSIGPHHVICVSDAVREGLIEHCGFASSKISTIHNGIDPCRFQPLLENRSARRAEWGIPHHALVFGAVGRLEREKGYDIGLGLVGRLVADFPNRDIRLVIIGDGSKEDELRRISSQAGLQERVKFISFTERTWQCYPAFDVLIMPSRIEGLPLVLLEAMACGCPPIAMAVGGIPEVITDESIGWLVKPGDKSEFFSAMKKVVESDPGRLAEMGRRARERVVSHFNARTQFSKLIKVIENECQGV